jgi:hypothetical protein
MRREVADQRLRVAEVSTAIPAAMWDDIYSSSRDPLPSHSRTWATSISATGQHRNVSRLYTFTDGAKALLPLFSSGSAMFHLNSLYSPPPAWGFGGLLSATPLTHVHIRAVLDDLVLLPALAVHIRPNPLEHEEWSKAVPESWIRIPRLAHVLSLAGGYAHVFSHAFKSDARNRIRKAEKAGLEIVRGNQPGLVAEFQGLLEQSVERWSRRQNEPLWLARWRAARRDPEDKFRTIAAAVGPLFNLWIARLDGKPVAGILVLRDRAAHYTRGAMDEQLAGKTYANYLLHAKAIEEACLAGCRYYHMGETGSSASLAQFKSRFGAAEVPYSEFRHERIPITAVDRALRQTAKRLIGFREH